jgi:hypothetical protein
MLRVLASIAAICIVGALHTAPAEASRVVLLPRLHANVECQAVDDTVPPRLQLKKTCEGTGAGVPFPRRARSRVGRSQERGGYVADRNAAGRLFVDKAIARASER